MSDGAFIPTNPLEEALRDAAADADAMPRLLAALAEGPLLVCVREAPGPDGRVELPMLEHDAHDHVLAFTSETQLQRAGYDWSPRIEIAGRDLTRLWPVGAWMAINPQGELGLSLAPDTVATLGGIPGESGRLTIPAGSELMIGEPAQEPVGLLETLSAAAAALPEVAALHRAWVLVHGRGDPPFLVVGIRLTAGVVDGDAVLAGLAQAAGEQASLILLEDGAQDAIGDWMIEQDAPFYEGTT